MEVRSILFSVAFAVILAFLEFTAVTTAQQEGSTTEPIQIQINSTDGDNKAGTHDNSNGNQVGMIVGIIIGILVLLAVIVGVLIYLIRTKRFASNKSEKDRAAQVQMTSARNAGVYVDLVTPGLAEKEAESPETEKLKRQDDEPEEV